MVQVKEGIRLGLLNLHDAFLNASLMKKQMEIAPIEADPTRFHASDRARSERLWVALLAVLIEAWDAKESKSIRNYIASVTPTTDLVDLLRQAKRSGRYDKILKCRHYAAHRGKKAYWDDGRLAPIGELQFNLKLHEEFSKVLLTAMRSISPTMIGANAAI